MGTTASDLILLAQRWYGDTSTHHFDTTAHWLTWINEAQDALARGSLGFETTFVIAVSSGVAIYSLPTTTSITPTSATVWKIRTAYWDHEAMDAMTIEDLDKTYSSTWREDGAGTPWLWYPFPPDRIGIHPAPTTAYATHLFVQAYYLPARMSATTNTCAIPERYNPGIAAFACARAADEDRDGDPRGLNYQRFWNQYLYYEQMYLKDNRDFSPRVPVMGGNYSSGIRGHGRIGEKASAP